MIGIPRHSIPHVAVPPLAVPGADSQAGSIEQALYEILKAAPRVTNLVGGARSPQIYPLGIPQGKTGAAVVYQQITSIDEYSCDGHVDPRTDRFQITCWSAQDGTPDAARILAEAVRMTLKAAAGVYGYVRVLYCSIEDEGDAYDLADDNETLTRFGKRQDWEIAYEP